MSRVHESYMQEVQNFFTNLKDEDFELSSCCFCQSQNRYIELFRKGTMSVHRCSCGHVYSGRQPTQDALNSFYKKSNAMDTWAYHKKSDDQIRKQSEKFLGVVEFVRENNIDSVLDIGCGNGHFLGMCESVSNRRGTDLNECAIEIGKRSGLNLEVKSIDETIEELHESNQVYDLITLFGVLEHVKRPLELVRKLRPHCKYLAVIVPNVEAAIVRHCWEKTFTFCPQHLNYFSMVKLDQVFEQAEFTKAEKLYTIEPETKPLLRASHGFDPYMTLPDWVESSIFNHDTLWMTEQMVIRSNQGYKIVYIGS